MLGKILQNFPAALKNQNEQKVSARPSECRVKISLIEDLIRKVTLYTHVNFQVFLTTSTFFHAIFMFHLSDSSSDQYDLYRNSVADYLHVYVNKNYRL